MNIYYNSLESHGLCFFRVNFFKGKTSGLSESALFVIRLSGPPRCGICPFLEALPREMDIIPLRGGPDSA